MGPAFPFRRTSALAAAVATLVLLFPRIAGAWGGYYPRSDATPAASVSTAPVVYNGYSSPATLTPDSTIPASPPSASIGAVASSTATAAAADAGSVGMVRAGGLQVAGAAGTASATSTNGTIVGTSGGYPPGYTAGGGSSGAGPNPNPAAGGGFGSGQPPTPCSVGQQQNATGGCVTCPSGTHSDGNGNCLPGEGDATLPPIAGHQDDGPSN